MLETSAASSFVSFVLAAETLIAAHIAATGVLCIFYVRRLAAKLIVPKTKTICRAKRSTST